MNVLRILRDWFTMISHVERDKLYRTYMHGCMHAHKHANTQKVELNLSHIHLAIHVYIYVCTYIDIQFEDMNERDMNASFVNVSFPVSTLSR